MSVSRRKSREIALQALFETEFTDNAPAIAYEQTVLLTEQDIDEENNYSMVLIEGVKRHQTAIDTIINDMSEGWEVVRMPLVDRNIIRMAIFEMRFAAEIIKPAVAINEAVELAKEFGTDDTRKFVNGLLSGVVKAMVAE